MNNNYFQYLSYHELLKKYNSVFELLNESEGILDDEILVKLQEIEDHVETLGFDLLNIIDNLENEKELNKKRVANIEKKNKSIDGQVEYLKKFLQTIIKKKGEITKSNGKNLKLGERSLTVSPKINYELSPDFNDSKFIKYNLSKISPDYIDRIKLFLEQRNETPELERIILKKEINAAMKNGEIIEGIIEVPGETLYIK